jgi:hypothetical protein
MLTKLFAAGRVIALVVMAVAYVVQMLMFTLQ